MDALQEKLKKLQDTAYKLLYLGEDNKPVYADDFSHLNQKISEQINVLYRTKGTNLQEEADICWTLLLGYSVSVYGGQSDEKKKQSILTRSWKVLDKLPSSLLKCRLLTFCYGEVYDEELLEEAHKIICTWEKRELSKEEVEIVNILQVMEDSPYPHCEVV